MKIKILIITILICTAGFGQNISKSGSTAAQFLKIGVGTRAIGMGGAFSATYADLSSIYWNPAGIAGIYSREVQFNHVDWIMDVNYDFASFAMKTGDIGTLGAFVSVLSMGEMPVRTNEQPEGTGEYFNAGGLQIGLSYARELTDNFSIGFNAKYVREHIWNMSATGFALDIGTLYKINILNEFRLGASISNFGTKMRLDGRDVLKVIQVGGSQGNLINTKIELDEYDMPLFFRVGIAADVVKEQDHLLTVALDAVHPNDNSEAINSGLEYSWNNIVFLRAGYKSLFEQNGEQGLTLGAGINYKIFDAVALALDYAYEDFGILTNVHYLTVGVKF
ncbi:MAG: UPF0164 family protein [Ignavibacteriales bacterium]|jgi:opacity protein-like surface antigen|nr:PorV/PorQ family protein [Ignavibacteriaceae bacterium]NLH60282.1 UPF0164 family protein [Ignavibacteriales bacterium]HOJ19176.1 PorV/PorQ family protein [Ignavibacteriaceae bacterium]HPO54695.1 PorV/PorQ family protein [Ignavibacteriaceae bacterium]